MNRRERRFGIFLGTWLAVSAAALVLAGCGDDGGDSSANTPSGTGASAPPGPPGNLPPTILSTPTASVSAGQAYSFQPSASDPNGDSLTFAITNKPSWATFSTTTGRLTGTPTEADVGAYGNIVISVSDGTARTTLTAFGISVTQISTGTATISWLPPTENTDGTPLVDLGGYRIYYGTSASALTEVAEISNPGLTLYVVQNLSPATWYFALQAYRTNGSTSALSSIGSKAIL